MIFDRHANLKYKYENGSSGVGILCGHAKEEQRAIAEYIRKQLTEDNISGQLTIKESYDPFAGEPANKSSPTWWGRS